MLFCCKPFIDMQLAIRSFSALATIVIFTCVDVIISLFVASHRFMHPFIYLSFIFLSNGWIGCFGFALIVWFLFDVSRCGRWPHGGVITRFWHVTRCFNVNVLTSMTGINKCGVLYKHIEAYAPWQPRRRARRAMF